ncbi:MAG TPA: glycosyltransferase family 39 protein, partial [Candidatus Saccharimonadales bacterium]|nr:glycosyltransferase family 39 protein [Candidatus Saccharimonadales bacterium]
MTDAGEAAPSPPVDRGSTTAIRFRFALGLTVLVAFVVRLLHVLSYDPWPTSDMAVFVDMATRRLTLPTLFSPQGVCLYPPGYALFLKAFLLVLEPFAAFAAVRIAQALLGAVTCWLVYRAGRRLHSRRAGLAGALITCFFQHFVFYSSVYMSENLFIPCFLAAFLAFLRAMQRGGARRLYVAGV